MAVISNEKIPEGFTGDTQKAFEVLHTMVREVTKVSRAEGMEDAQLISAIMSATITELAYITGCPERAARVLDTAAVTLKETFGGKPDHERTH